MKNNVENTSNQPDRVTAILHSFADCILELFIREDNTLFWKVLGSSAPILFLMSNVYQLMVKSGDLYDFDDIFDRNREDKKLALEILSNQYSKMSDIFCEQATKALLALSVMAERRLSTVIL